MNRMLKAIQSLTSGVFSRLIPRSNQVWVFGGNKGLRFADNSMFFFKYCAKHTDKTPVWLTRSDKVLDQVRSEGYLAHKTNSLSGLYYGFRAGWHIFDVSIGDTSVISSVGARHLNLWHGYPFKDIRRLRNSAQSAGAGFFKIIWNWLCNNPKNNSDYYVVHQNKQYLWQITESFDVKDENVVIANYPRNIVFSPTASMEDVVSISAKETNEKLERIRANGKRVIGYFPTWRTGDEDQFMGTRCVDRINELNKFLERNNLVIATKWHTCVFKEYEHDGVSETAEQLNYAMNTLSNFIVLDFEQDLNSVINQCDVLVSDYSSVIVDYLLSGRPQVFMAYDLESYTEEWGFTFDYESFVPGPIVKTIDELMDTLAEYSRSPGSFSMQHHAERAARRCELFDTEIGSETIFHFMDLR